MKTHTKGFLSAVVSAALCIANIPLRTVNADIVIDQNSSGIDKGYFFEIANNDEDAQPELYLMPGGGFRCVWDNEEDFSVARGLKFASPVKYSKLGDMSYKYYQSISKGLFTDTENGFLRFGIRLHNSKGDEFTILEIDDSADYKSIAEKDKSYKKICSIDSKEIFNDYLFGQRVKGNESKVTYTIYARENKDKTHSFVCRRDTPLTTNSMSSEDRRMVICDKMDAIAAAGYDLGEITDITLFLENAYSEGSAYISTIDIDIENMPEIAPDEYEDENAPLTVTDYDYGVRTGYYYAILGRAESDKMELIAPSLFKAEWDSSGNYYNNDEYFERGKQYEPGQSYKAVSGSSIEYTMDFDVEGSFAVSALARLGTIEMPKYYLNTEIYIVDACTGDWTPSQFSNNKIGEFSAEGFDYDVYDGSQYLIGSGKAHDIQKYFFIRNDAVENGSKGTVTVKHDLEPYMGYIHDMGVVLGNADVLVAQVNGDIAVGNAELVKLDVALPGFIADENEYEKETRRIEIGGFDEPVYVNGLAYNVSDGNMKMTGYAGEKISYEWEPYQAPEFSSNNTEYYRSFNIGLPSVMKNDNSYGCENNESLLFDYNIDIGDITSDKADSKWVLGGYITCSNPYYSSVMGADGSYYGCDILIADKWYGELTSEFAYGSFRDPENLGVIESDGVKYDVIAYMPEVQNSNAPFIIVKRQKQLEAVGAEDVPAGHTRYANSFDAADIIRKVNKLGINTYEIENAYFSLNVLRNEGSAVVNSVSIKKVQNNTAAYTADDISALTDFLLGKKADVPAGKDYDLNGDGVWDTFDLCLMRKALIQSVNAPVAVSIEETGMFAGANTIRKVYKEDDKFFLYYKDLSSDIEPLIIEISEQDYSEIMSQDYDGIVNRYNNSTDKSIADWGKNVTVLTYADGSEKKITVPMTSIAEKLKNMSLEYMELQNVYVKPARRSYGPVFLVPEQGMKLYSGPDESYRCLAEITSLATLNELGYQADDDPWLFTEYNGIYGWIKIKDENDKYSVIYQQVAAKPVIYLYPEEETDVHVELELTDADLSTTYPKYNNGWDVTAYPDGSLLNKSDGTHHKYLFWDAVNCRTRFDLSKGFCIAGSDTESFLREKLTYMGLTEEEMNEFIVYWLPLMEHNAYNLIAFQGDIYTNSAKLDITPAPDSLLRIFMAYVPLENAVDVEPQQLETFERKGFTVVEWGGSKIKD